MKVLLRADAGIIQGTGHIMRCLTLAEALSTRGHEAELAWAGTDVPWLAQHVRDSGIRVHESMPDVLDKALIEMSAPDWVVVDSYRIPAEEISAANELTPVLAIVDGDDRGIEATLYLDHNLGARAETYRHPARVLAGADYALVRDEVLQQRRPEPWSMSGPRPTIVSFMGGTDPTAASIPVVRALIAASASTRIIVVAPQQLHKDLETILANREHSELLSPTPALPELFGLADLVVSAAGTSAWDVCALAIPAVLVGVVDNQSASITSVVETGVALAIAVSKDTNNLVTDLTPLVTTLLTDQDARVRLSQTCRRVFDGEGKSRVVKRMEEAVSG